uniref:Uncharacterized protein n=1 Tax=uncultured marine virus TaxID=186617 RepID=A0A0F7L960_9VIRU|nr:hypothetical protein [uncultured marine virus]
MLGRLGHGLATNGRRPRPLDSATSRRPDDPARRHPPVVNPQLPRSTSGDGSDGNRVVDDGRPAAVAGTLRDGRPTARHTRSRDASRGVGRNTANHRQRGGDDVPRRVVVHQLPPDSAGDRSPRATRRRPPGATGRHRDRLRTPDRSR